MVRGIQLGGMIGRLKERLPKPEPRERVSTAGASGAEVRAGATKCAIHCGRGNPAVKKSGSRSRLPKTTACTANETSVLRPRWERLAQEDSQNESANMGVLLEIEYCYLNL
jgi:hypothetical protein